MERLSEEQLRALRKALEEAVKEEKKVRGIVGDVEVIVGGVARSGMQID